MKGAACALMLVAAMSAVRAGASEPPPLMPPDMEAFAERVAAAHGIDHDALRDLLLKVQFQSGVIRAVNAPATARPWKEFRPGFLNRQRIEGGAKFWAEHERWLTRAREKWGVPEELVVAIVGVETQYGRNTGTFRVLDAVSTLAFQVPTRALFFQGELEAFLLMCRENGLDPLAVRGSYAGAMGWPQFIPSSYRRYARDFDGDGRVDLFGTPADVIGSVANYLAAFGWKRDANTVLRAAVQDPLLLEDALKQGVKPSFGAGHLVAWGAVPEQPLADEETVAVMRFEGANGPEYWLGLDNFWVITRYNRSQNYALAVWQLSQEIAAARAKPATSAPTRKKPAASLKR
ncbi:MAG: lytic murein transglycosylase B [Burkholderiales bacterium]|nr:lytic murein transglycosylase B [Burkholderiales bacterium]